MKTTVHAKDLLNTFYLFSQGIMLKASSNTRLANAIQVTIRRNGNMSFVGWNTEEYSALEVRIAGIPAVNQDVNESKIVVPYSELSAMIESLKTHGYYEITVTDTLTVLDEAGRTINIKSCVDTDKFDALPVLKEDGSCIGVGAEALAEALKKTAPFVSGGASRYATSGVHFTTEAGGDSLGVVSTDSYRLSLVSIPSDKFSGSLENKDCSAHWSVAGKALAFIKKMAPKVFGNFTVSFDDRHGLFEVDNWSLYTTLSDGMFPRYLEIIPDWDSLQGKLFVDRESLVSALKLAKKLANKESGAIRLVPSEEGKAVSVEVWEKQKLKLSQAVKAASLKCPDILFGVDFLSEALTTFKESIIEIRFKDHLNPIMIRSGNYIHLLMPFTRGISIETDFPTVDEERYREAVAQQDQDASFLTTITAKPKVLTTRKPSFAAVVKRALADSQYMNELLGALGVDVSSVNNIAV